VGDCGFCYTGSKDGRIFVLRGIAVEVRLCPSCLKRLRMQGGGHTLETCRQRVLESQPDAP